MIWTTLSELKNSNITQKDIIAADICNKIISCSKDKGSNDNLSVIFIGFNNFFNNKKSLNKILKKIENQNCNEMIA